MAVQLRDRASWSQAPHQRPMAESVDSQLRVKPDKLLWRGSPDWEQLSEAENCVPGQGVLDAAAKPSALPRIPFCGSARHEKRMQKRQKNN